MQSCMILSGINLINVLLTFIYLIYLFSSFFLAFSRTEVTIHSSSNDVLYPGDSVELTCTVSNSNSVHESDVHWSKLNGDPMERNARAEGEKLRQVHKLSVERLYWKELLMLMFVSEKGERKSFFPVLSLGCPLVIYCENRLGSIYRIIATPRENRNCHFGSIDLWVCPYLSI